MTQILDPTKAIKWRKKCVVLPFLAENWQRNIEHFIKKTDTELQKIWVGDLGYGPRGPKGIRNTAYDS
jgi:hypothetical protein